MSGPENFFSRWSRLKREPASQKGSVDEPRLAKPVPDAEVRATPPVDLTELPPIESIDAASDIRQFLQAGVPPELTRAALRSAWTADPAICGFIGIADNQWDFNGEGTIPGFGALTPADYEPRVLAMLRPSHPTAAAVTPESPDPTSLAASTNQNLEPPEAAEELRAAATLPDRRRDDGDTNADVANDITNSDSAMPTDTPQEDTRARPRIRHSHGGALPK